MVVLAWVVGSNRRPPSLGDAGSPLRESASLPHPQPLPIAMGEGRAASRRQDSVPAVGDPHDTSARVVNLTKRFDGLAAIRRPRSRRAARCHPRTLGPNGAGKSTFDLVTCPTGHLRRRLLLRRADHRSTAPIAARVSVSRANSRRQHPLPELPAAENLFLGKVGHRGWNQLLQTRDTPAADAEVVELLARLRLGRYRHARTRAATLSHGQQQWLEIGGFCSQARPRLLLLDEPTAGRRRGKPRLPPRRCAN